MNNKVTIISSSNNHVKVSKVFFIRLYYNVIALVVCLGMLVTPFFDCFASTPLLPGAALPSVGIGETLPAPFINVDIGGYLSHVYDETNRGARRWGGRLWNALIDDSVCPEAYAQNVNGGRHSFIYGLTNRDGVTGYYSYCQYCGQFAGDLATEYQESNYNYTVSSSGIDCPCFVSVPFVPGKVYGYNVYFVPYWNFNSTTYDYSNVVNVSGTNIFAYSSIYGTGLYDLASKTYDYISGSIRFLPHGYSTTFTGFTSSTGPGSNLKNPVLRVKYYSPLDNAIKSVPANELGLISYDRSKFMITEYASDGTISDLVYSVTNSFIYGDGTTRSDGVVIVLPNNAGVNYRYDVGLYDGGLTYHYGYNVSIDDEDNVLYNTNYINLDAPVSFVNSNNEYVYGGTTSNFYDFSSSTVKGGETNYSYDSYSYDYSDNSITFDLTNSDDSIVYTFGDENFSYNYLNSTGDVTTQQTYYYVTLVNEPAADVTADPTVEITPTPEISSSPAVTSSPGGSGSGSTGIDVNVNFPAVTVQVPIIADGQTDAIVTAPQNIPEGLYTIREKLAQSASFLPDLAGDVTGFFSESFTFLPDELKNLIYIGVSFSVIAVIWHMFR